MRWRFSQGSLRDFLKNKWRIVHKQMFSTPCDCCVNSTACTPQRVTACSCVVFGVLYTNNDSNLVSLLP